MSPGGWLVAHAVTHCPVPQVLPLTVRNPDKGRGKDAFQRFAKPRVSVSVVSLVEGGKTHSPMLFGYCVCVCVCLFLLNK